MSTLKTTINIQTALTCIAIILAVTAVILNNWLALGAAVAGLVGLVLALSSGVKAEREVADLAEKHLLEKTRADKNQFLYEDCAARLNESRQEVLKLTEEIRQLVAAQQNPAPVEVVASASLEQEEPKKKRSRAKKSVQSIKTALKTLKENEGKS